MNKLMKHQEALKDYATALSIDPKYSLGHYNKGIVYLTLQQYDNALMAFSKVIE